MAAAPAPPPGGSLKVLIQGARDLLDVNPSGPQRPYFVLTCGEQCVRSRAAEGGTPTAPRWGAAHRFALTGEEAVVAVVLRDEAGGAIIGEALIDLERCAAPRRAARRGPGVLGGRPAARSGRGGRGNGRDAARRADAARSGRPGRARARGAQRALQSGTGAHHPPGTSDAAHPHPTHRPPPRARSVCTVGRDESAVPLRTATGRTKGLLLFKLKTRHRGHKPGAGAAEAEALAASGKRLFEAAKVGMQHLQSEVAELSSSGASKPPGGGWWRVGTLRRRAAAAAAAAAAGAGGFSTPRSSDGWTASSSGAAPSVALTAEPSDEEAYASGGNEQALLRTLMESVAEGGEDVEQVRSGIGRRPGGRASERARRLRAAPPPAARALVPARRAHALPSAPPSLQTQAVADQMQKELQQLRAEKVRQRPCGPRPSASAVATRPAKASPNTAPQPAPPAPRAHACLVTPTPPAPVHPPGLPAGGAVRREARDGAAHPQPLHRAAARAQRAQPDRLTAVCLSVLVKLPAKVWFDGERHDRQE
jgi:hypothetical protein